MLPDTLGGDFGGGLPARCRVWPDVVVVLPASGRDEPGIGQRGQFLCDPRTGQRRVCHRRQAFPRVVVGHPQDAEAPTADQTVGYEVERSRRVRSMLQHHRRPRAERSLGPATATHPQPFFAVDAQQFLVVGRHALPRQQIAQTAVTELATFSRQFGYRCRKGASSGLMERYRMTCLSLSLLRFMPV